MDGRSGPRAELNTALTGRLDVGPSFLPTRVMRERASWPVQVAFPVRPGGAEGGFIDQQLLR